MKNCPRCNSNRIETKNIESLEYFSEIHNCLDCGYRDYSTSTKEIVFESLKNLEIVNKKVKR